jgi:16S rRNA (cytosine967-C5)-methyltransferase
MDILSLENVSATESLLTPEGIICHEHLALDNLNSLKEGLFQIQDEASMLVAHILGAKPGEFIIDACGGPGGKSAHIAALMENKGRVFSGDIHQHKLALVKNNADKLGISIIETKIQDANLLGEIFKNLSDRVLVDAPCSGLGVLRRKPDSRWRKTEETLAVLPKLQLSILSSSADCVKPGGTLLYSTCTTEPEENEEIIKTFLASRSDYSLDNTGEYLPEKKQSEKKLLQFWPHKDNIDGFFMARMTRTSIHNS